MSAHGSLPEPMPSVQPADNGRTRSEGPDALVGDDNGNHWNAHNPPSRANSEPLPDRPDWTRSKSIRHKVALSGRKFDITTVPADLQRVYGQLKERFGEEYALIFVFTVRTAVELHRAWHMTLLTSKILQSIKDRFNMRMTWNLGVLRCIFRVEDGGFELHRRVPYDYDSEYQDLYMKIAVALVEGHIDVHQALIFQAETKAGLHTADSGRFLRDNPGRLVLYPIEAATCTVIFFGGDWEDAGVAACCGFAAGCVEYFLSWIGGDAKVLIDFMVGVSTGVIGGLFYQLEGPTYCLTAIFLGTLYWFFYGTAFVIGLLEIIAGELETGVTRFIAVSVKTFVLTIGSCVGLLIALKSDDVFGKWEFQEDNNCGLIKLDEKWWRIPLYLLCSASALGQYRVPIVHYWRGLVIQLVGYEVQYQLFKYFDGLHDQDFLDTAVSNIGGAAAAVLAACALSYVVDHLGAYYNARLLQRDIPGENTMVGEFVYRFISCFVRGFNAIGLGRRSSVMFLRMETKLKQQTRELADPKHPRTEIKLTPEEEVVLVEAIVDAENLNIWSLLMPAVYQLVPGSLIARLWYNAMFPPSLVTNDRLVVFSNNSTGIVSTSINGIEGNYTDSAVNEEADDVFYGLFVVSTSLAMGLILGFSLVQTLARMLTAITTILKCGRESDQTEQEQELEEERIKRQQFRQQGVLPMTGDDDPDGGDNEPVLARAGARSKEIGRDRISRILESGSDFATTTKDKHESDPMIEIEEEQSKMTLGSEENKTT